MESALTTHLFSQPIISESSSLLIALFVALVVHAFIVSGINFTVPVPEKNNKPIEITLSSSPSKKVPKKAKHLAPDNQLDAGKKNRKPEPPKQKTLGQGKSNKKPVQDKTQKESKPKQIVENLITQKQAEQKISSIKPTPPAAKPRPKLSPQSLQKQIARLGAEIRYKQSSEQTKIKSIGSVSTHKLIGVQYQKDWGQKIERIGNLNYPKVARKKGLSGTLTMDVGISANGSIYGMSIIKSSGIKALDDAAKRIVMLSTPFSVLPEKLLEELEVLVIRKVWNFSDESGMTTLR